MPAHIMHGRKEVLPSVCLCEVKVYLSWVKSLNPSTLSFGLDESALWIHQVFHPFRSSCKPLRNVHPSEGVGVS